MKRITSILLLAVLVLNLAYAAANAQRKTPPPETRTPHGPRADSVAFIVHGGAGVIPKSEMTPEREKEYRDKLHEAVMAGYAALKAGKSSMDAVEIAIRILEDSPLFNAGKGAVFTNDGRNELDASVMDGKTLAAGAVAGLRRVKNPITLARAVMEKSPHVMMIGEGAEKFAVEQKIELVDPKYFWTQHRWDALQKILKEEKAKSEKGEKVSSAAEEARAAANRFGTVGAVALDKNGNIAAGTSTGGMTNKKYGRVGDAPIIGAGTYANNETCGVSGTGWGEYFIRLGVARDISTLIEYRAVPVYVAVDRVIKDKLQKAGGDGGVIAIDKFGSYGVSFNSEGMYRAYIDEHGKPVVEIY